MQLPLQLKSGELLLGGPSASTVLLVPREVTQGSPGSSSHGWARSYMNTPVHMEEKETPLAKQTFWVY